MPSHVGTPTMPTDVSVGIARARGSLRSSVMSLPHHAPRARVRAFTLVELLGVIGIIAILIGLAFPVMSRVRKQAAGVQCMSNVRQLMTLTFMYANDWKNVLPYTGWGDGPTWPSNPSSQGYPCWAYDGAVSGARGTFALDDIRTGALYQYCGGKVELFRCPLDTGPWLDPTWYTVMTTYCANGSMGGWAGPARKITRFSAFEAAMYWEVGAFASGGEGWDGANTPTEGITVRHSGRSTTVGFLDGHVDRYTVEQFNRELNYGPSTLWCNPDLPQGGFDGNTNHSVLFRDN